MHPTAPPGPGLDIDQLRGLRRTRHDLDLIRARIAAHLDDVDGYLAFSGGKDSLVVLHLALQVDPNVPVVFFDSGLEFPETYTYLSHLADAWNLNWQPTPPPVSILEAMLSGGAWDHHAPTLPGLQHGFMEAVATAHTRHGPGEIWGVRAAESNGRNTCYRTALARHRCTCCNTHTQRARRHGGRYPRTDGTTVYGPIWNWTDTDVWTHISHHQLPPNPVYDKLRTLGAPQHFMRISQMIDGGRLEEGRAVWLKRGWPHLYEELRTLLPRLHEYT